MRRRISWLLPCIALMFGLSTSTQAVDDNWQIIGQVRPRMEFRNGYRTLPSWNRNDGVAFISQRTRLGLKYSGDPRANMTVILQDVRTWGDESGTASDYDADNFDVFRAFIDLSPDSTWTFRIGRQGLGYDEDRILGDGDWSQQGRSHDAIRVIWKSGPIEAHIAFAHNERGEPITYAPYPVTSNYQDLALAWLRVKSGGVGLSVLSVADFYEGHSPVIPDYSGLPLERGTVGPRIEFNRGAFRIRGEGYYQFGTIASVVDPGGFPVVPEKEIDAYMIAGSITGAFKKSEATLWCDYLSGDSDYNYRADGSYEVFDPPYATTHKYYGWADYFINIPADTRGLGLIDLSLKLKTRAISNAAGDLQLHYFWYAKEAPLIRLSGHRLRALGFEADAMVTLPLTKSVRVQAGYSVVLPKDTLEFLKRGVGTGHWFWTMLDFNVK